MVTIGIWNICIVGNLSDKIHSIPLLGSIICDKTLKCDHQTCWKKQENLNIIDNILLSKCWGTEAVFHLVNFCLWRFICWSFIKKSFCDNIKTTLGKTFMWKSDINFFEITIPPYQAPRRCLLGNLPFIFWGCSWYLFVVMMIFICFIVIDLFQ